MNWAHLPVAGGIYDQHPDFVRYMLFVLAKKSEAEAEEDRKQKAKAAQTKNKSRPSR